MTQSLRIKENGYSSMYAEHLKATKDAKATLEPTEALHDQAVAANAKQSELVDELAKVKESNMKYKKENEFLKHKLKYPSEKLNKEVESNRNLFASIKLAKEALNPEFPMASTKKRRFLAQINCIEVLDPVESKGKSTTSLRLYRRWCHSIGLKV